MARKKLTKAQQILGLRRAMKNPKTPKQFLPSMKKRLAKLTAVVAVLFALCGVAHAQNSVSPFVYQQVLATNVACTGSNQDFAVNNRNITQHVAYTSTNAQVNSLVVQIYGKDLAGNTYKLSDDEVQPTTLSGFMVTGSGYYPFIFVRVKCSGTASPTFSLAYSGGSATFNVNAGSYMTTQSDKIIFTAAPESASTNLEFQTPFLNSSGTINFTYQSASIAGSAIEVDCLSNSGSIETSNSFFFHLANVLTTQSFPIPPQDCPYAQAFYDTGSGGAGTFIMEYLFRQPGFANPSLSIPLHITGTTAVVVKQNSGTLVGLTLNTAAAGTLSVFDLASAACTGTPSTNITHIFTINATDAAHAIPLNENYQNGICVKASVAMDWTAQSQ